MTMQQQDPSKKALIASLLLWLNSSDQAHARMGASGSYSRMLTTNSCYPNAKTVRLESTTGEQIQMFELKAISSGENVALNKTAVQSSTFKTKYASLALDGDSTTFSHTDDGNTTNAFWEADLGTSYPLESVLVENRWCTNPSDINGCLCRLSGATLSLLDEQDEVISIETIGNTCGVVDLSFDLSSACTEIDTPPTPPMNGETVPLITFSDAVIVGDESFAITFNNPLDQTEIYAAVISQSHCTVDNSSFEVDSNIQNVAFGPSSATVTQNIKDLITAEQKNSGSVHMMFCLRADVRSAGFPSSLMASKVSVGITINFEDESGIVLNDSSSGFTLEVETSGFSESTIDYTTDRNVDVSAVLGECASPGNEGPYDIGSTLNFCVESNDSDVIISALSDVSFTDSDGNSILSIVDGVGEPSFVTAIEGLESNAVDVATLMATTIFDQGYGGKTINVQGTVSVTYIDQTPGARRRQLKTEEIQQFALKIVVGGNESTQQTDSHHWAFTNQNQAIGAVVASLCIGGLLLVSFRRKAVNTLPK
jgi:hypothetical protein